MSVRTAGAPIRRETQGATRWAGRSGSVVAQINGLSQYWLGVNTEADTDIHTACHTSFCGEHCPSTQGSRRMEEYSRGDKDALRNSKKGRNSLYMSNIVFNVTYISGCGRT